MNFEQRVKEFEKYKAQNGMQNYEMEYWGDENLVYISCSHSARHKRNGKVKSERGESHTAIVAKDIAYLLNKKYGKDVVAIMYKTNNEEDDPNYNEKSEYRKKLVKMLENKEALLFDLHTMNNDRALDIEIGTDYGNNIKKDSVLLNRVVGSLKNNGLKLVVDERFSATTKYTVSHDIARRSEGIKAIQIEMNWENYISPSNYAKLLYALVNMIDTEVEERMRK